MADTYFSIPDINGATLNHRSATNGSSYQHPATSLFLFGGGTPVEVSTANAIPFRRSDGSSLVDDFQVLAAGTELTFTLTRPADTNAYAANDAISSSTSSPTNPSISGMARVNAGRGRITRCRVTTSQITFAGTIAIHVWHTNPTAINDNAVYTTVDSANKCGTIFVSGFRTVGAGSAITEAEVDCNLTFKCASASTTLYFALEAITAFTPASAQTFKAYFDVVQQ